MNKQQIDMRIFHAYQSIARCGLLNEKKKLDSGYRGQIATLGAAIRQSSLLAALAFFSEQKNAIVDRSKLLACIYYILMQGKQDDDLDNFKENLFSKVAGKEFNKNAILQAVIALKLAMNLYPLSDDKEVASNGK